MSRQEVNERVREVIGQVGLPPESGLLYPYEFSGGQRQRIAWRGRWRSNPNSSFWTSRCRARRIDQGAGDELAQDLQENFGVAYC